MTKWIVLMVLLNVLTTWSPIGGPASYWADISSSDESLCIVYASTDTCPIVFFVGGKDLLKKNVPLYPYYEDGKQIYFEAKDAEKFGRKVLEQIDQQPFFCYATNNNRYLGQISLEKIIQKKSYEVHWKDFVEFKEFYCNRKNLTPSVEYHRYTISEQKQIPTEYIKHLKNLFSDNGLFKTPPVITDIWQVDLDCDGKQEIFVKSCNSNSNWQTSEEERAQAMDQDIEDMNGIGSYLVLSLYSETLGQYDLFELCGSIDENIESFSKQNLIDQGEKESWIELADRQYQYDANGCIRLMPVYASGETANLSHYFCQPLFFDANNDGIYDLMLRTGWDYTAFALYLTFNKQLRHEYDLIVGP